MTNLALAVPLIFAMSLAVSPTNKSETALIEGGVFDRYGAVIPKVPISVEELQSHSVNNAAADDNGHYSITVKPGHYLLTEGPTPGWPIAYQHSSFYVSAGERVVIDFRPRWSYPISDSIEDGHWIEKYDTRGNLPSTIVHYVQQPDGTIKDIRIQYLNSRAAAGTIAYNVSVTASFDRYTIYADDRVVYYPKRLRLTTQNALLEDGRSTLSTKTLEIDLKTGSLFVDGAKYVAPLGKN